MESQRIEVDDVAARCHQIRRVGVLVVGEDRLPGPRRIPDPERLKTEEAAPAKIRDRLDASLEKYS
jgi:hypothetical protein